MKKLTALLLTLLFLAGASAETMIANPWTDTTAEALMETLGLSLKIPEGAYTVRHRMLEAQSLAELQFDMGGIHFCARVKPCAEFEDISGVYGEWTKDEPAAVGWCEGRLMRSGDGEAIYDVLLWYDAAPGLMYCVSAVSAEGTDLLPVAGAVYRPVQGDAG